MMRFRLHTLLMVLALGPLILRATSCPGQSPHRPAAAPPVHYSSPTAVFNAYSDALSQRDLRKCFQCLTPDAQADAVFETFFSCGMHASDEVSAVCKKYFGNPEAWQNDYGRRYKEKHGVSIEEVRAKEQVERPRGATATSDRELLVQVLNAHLQDRAGFYEAANNLMEDLKRNPADKGQQQPIQELRDVVVKGDQATGTIDVIVVSYYSGNGEPSQRRESKVPKTLNFRKIGAGWLIDLH